MEIQLSLTDQEVNALLQVVGGQPTSSNLWPLFVKIKTQAEACIAQSKEN